MLLNGYNIFMDNSWQLLFPMASERCFMFKKNIQEESDKLFLFVKIAFGPVGRRTSFRVICGQRE